VFARIGRVNGLSDQEIEERMNEIYFEGENYGENSVIQKNFKTSQTSQLQKSGDGTPNKPKVHIDRG